METGSELVIKEKRSYMLRYWLIMLVLLDALPIIADLLTNSKVDRFRLIFSVY